MKLLGNIIWFIFGGLWAFLGYVIGGALLCLTIVGIPFGIQSFKNGVATLSPFGKEVTASPEADSPLRLIFNVIWIFLIGWELAISHLVFALILGVTIIGIPFAQQHIKLLPLALFPFGRRLETARPVATPLPDSHAPAAAS